MVNYAGADDEIQEQLADTVSRSELLLSDNRTYRQAAERQKDEELIALLEDLELVLVEISNLDPGTAEFALPSVKRIIQKKNLLIKIEIINLDATAKKSDKTEVI